MGSARTKLVNCYLLYLSSFISPFSFFPRDLLKERERIREIKIKQMDELCMCGTHHGL